MRKSVTILVFLLVFGFTSGKATAQLSVSPGHAGADAGAMNWDKSGEKEVSGLSAGLLRQRFTQPTGLSNPLTNNLPTPRTFDFTKTAPHLAFFCRLEINEEAGFVIPAKFRLGGHSHWQDNLLRSR